MKVAALVLKSLALLAFASALAIAPFSQAQTTPANSLYFTSSANIPAGRYVSQQPFCIHGGKVLDGGGRTLDNERITIGIAERAEFEDLNLSVSNANIQARNVHFKGCTIDLGMGARLSFEDCIFDQVTFSLGGTVPSLNNGTQSADQVFERYRGHLSLKNSVLNKAQFQLKGGLNAVVGLKMDQCTVHGPGSLLPMLFSKPGFLDDMKRGQTEVTSCTFVQSSYSSPFMAVTRDCVFDTCTLIAGLPLEGVNVPLPITASFHPVESSEGTAAQLPQYVITPVTQGVFPGCTLQYSLAAGEVTRNELPTEPLSARPLASVLPPITPGAMTTRSTPGTMLPTTPNTTVPGMPTQIPNTVTPSQEPTVNMVEARVSGTYGAPDTGLKLQQTNVHGLLIMSLGSGQAGSASKMGAIALQAERGLTASVKFNQPVGEMMAKALEEVAKFTQLNNKGWPQGYNIELSFADKYSNKDGPSAAVACALLLHSLITGKELDPAFAVTGDMNADGSVQPIGGVAAKIRGATKGDCKIIGIPSKNESSLGDLLLTDGPAPFASIQIYSLVHFADAEALAITAKPETTQLAVAEMSRVQEVLLRNPSQMGSWLRNQHVIAKLQQVLKDSPNNLSAKYLLMYATGRVPQTLSLAGSLSAIDDTAGDLIASIKADKGQAFDNMGKGSVGSSLTRLQTLRARCDVRTRPYADAIIDFGSAVKEALDRPAQTSTRANELRNKIRGAANAVDSQLSRLVNDPAVREELEQ
ncbi:MAG TPA: S16 family serine protease [Candidatus Saccharimonadia bacterium]|nr:S16 family serine protease [Candidatus Saccharimonadia bacterium]